MAARLKSLLIIFISLLYLSFSTFFVPQDYASIQEAIDNSPNGTTIIVNPGVYIENINFNGKEIYIKSANGPDNTIIEGNQNGSVVTFDHYETNTSILEGFTIKNGSGTFVNSVFYGGGIYCNLASPVIKNNIIANNVARFGAGVALIDCDKSLIIDSCIIQQNQASGIGGGIGGGVFSSNSMSTITKSFINNNYTVDGLGGGIALRNYSELNIIDNFISNNIAEEHGGGIYSSNSSIPSIYGNIIQENIAHDGAGIFLWDGNICDNIIIDNTAMNLDLQSIPYKYGLGGGICTGGVNPLIEGN